MSDIPPTATTPPPRRKYVRTVGPQLRILLNVVMALFAILGANSVYLTTVTFLNWLAREKNVSYENYFYQFMFLAHLVLGVLIVLPVILFGIFHIKNSWNRPNRNAIRVGYALFSAAIALLVSGVVLMRVEGLEWIQFKSPSSRSTAYWIHVLTPFACIWLYILHRLSGPKLKWRCAGP